MPARNVLLTDHYIEALVGYRNRSDVLPQGLRPVEQREALEAAKLKALQDAAAVGFSDLDEGRFREVRSDALPEFIAALGRRAAGGAAG